MADGDREIRAIISAQNKATAALMQFRGQLGLVAVSFGAVMAAAGAAAVFLAKATKAAAEQEAADVKLAQALSLVGRNTKETRDDLGAYAQQLQRTTKFSDEEVQSVLALMTSFARLEGEGLKRATKATLDWAEFTGQDAVSSASALAKIIETGTGRLKGISFQFEEGTTKAERYEQVMRKVEATTGGTAEAMGKTLTGTMVRLGNQFDELYEKIGNAILQDEGFRLVLEKTVSLLDSLGSSAEGARSPVVQVAKAIAILAGVIGQVLFTALNVGVSAVLGWVRIAELMGMAVGRDTAGITRFADSLAATSQNLVKGRAVLGDMMDLLLSTDKVLPSAAEGTKNLAGAVRDLGEAAKKSPLEELGLQTFAQMQKRAELVQKALVQALSDPKATAKFKGEMISALEEINAELTKVGLGLPGLAAAAQVTFMTQAEALQRFIEEGSIALKKYMAEANVQIEALGQTIEVTFRDFGVGAVLDFSDALIEAAAGGQISFTKLFKSLMVDLAKAIARAVLLKLILGFATSGASEVFGTSLGGGVYGIAKGGEVPRAAPGGIVRGSGIGRDTVGALLMPGEVVLPSRLRGDFQAISQFARSVLGSEGTEVLRRGPKNFYGNFMIAPRGNDRAEGIRLMDAINRLVRYEGYQLIASELVG